jgi:uncharacterized protein
MPSTPILNSLILKVASRCNLSCTYCYEYHLGDTSWKSQPHFMSEEVLTQTARRMREHAERRALRRFSVSFHGGEPLLAGPEYFERAANILRQTLGPDIRVDLGVQTNGTLLTEEFVACLDRNRISVAVSLDGPLEVNDRFRIYSGGRGSYDDIVRGLQCLRSPAGRRVFAGILSVIQLGTDPLQVFDELVRWGPRAIDFLLPHGNWSRFPPGKEDPAGTPYADYLITIFDAWWNGRHSHIGIRTFEELIEHRMGGAGTLEVLGLAPVRLIVVACNGNYEAVDTMKSVAPNAHVLGLNVACHTLDDVAEHLHVAARHDKLASLAAACRQCELQATCGGGYYPHRFCAETGFDNPSIYCADYLKLIPHLRAAVEAEVVASS